MVGTIIRLLLANTYVFLIFVGSTLQCGPGRNSGMRKARKMTPLVFKQHVPNVSENTLGASGPSEGRITRQDPRFKDLVINNNPNIVFKDEEGTGIDKIMSQRCKDKLDALAILVRNHWQGVRLRVIEVWDENGHSPQESLHQEGRAVDITTSDRDRSKYGMLARLAVNAGFDWVYYESRGHIHCSVRSDSSLAVQMGGCFSSHSTVQLIDGSKVPMDQLAVGDRVLSIDPKGNFQYEPVIGFLHRSPNMTSTVWSIETQGGQILTLTPDHLIFSSKSPQTITTGAGPSFAARLHPNSSFVFVKEPGIDSVRPWPSKVTRLTVTRSVGLFAPLTSSGTIVVDDVVASCYAFIDSHTVAHLVVAPLRLLDYVGALLRYIFPSFPSETSRSSEQDGIHWYAQMLYAFGSQFAPSSVWFSSDLIGEADRCQSQLLLSDTA